MTWENMVVNFNLLIKKLTYRVTGTMMKLWTYAINADKKVSIARAIKFYENYEKVLIFVLETGEM
jgi:hypothetical protein